MRYADIIIDISSKEIDRTFQYRIPDSLQERLAIGSVVKVPFGSSNRSRTGYVVGFSEQNEIEESRLKDILEVEEKKLAVERKMIMLAGWIKDTYGSTMVAAINAVTPVKEKVRKQKAKKDIRQFEPEFLPIDSLNEQQRAVFQTFEQDYDNGIFKTYLLHGITGSGKTEVYLRMAKKVIEAGKSVIVLVPEIALTYQTVARFSTMFKGQISVLNSRLNKGEKFREFQKAIDGNAQIMIGPRSALFAPFSNLGLIIIDEEHDGAYKSEKTPRYHARETAIERARIEGGVSVVLGSATPSIDSYYRAKCGEYTLLSMDQRATENQLPEVKVVDLREELKRGNRSILSQELYDALSEAFSKKQQAMIFINRRGYSSFISCRSCGDSVKCPHCDVSLSQHNGYYPFGKEKEPGYMMCHYCGYVARLPKKCPGCGSNLIGGFGIGTEKVEAYLHSVFPEIRTLRLDRDTTVRKEAQGEIIQRFRNKEADCLIGTQMIVKGHDFGNVTVVGAILADQSLFAEDFKAAERTFDLLTQAAGRAGRGENPGKVIIQTYKPEHYAIENAAGQDYKSFYEYEIAYRKVLRLPPTHLLMGVLITSDREMELSNVTGLLAEELKRKAEDKTFSFTGPGEAAIYKLNDIYRKVVYIRTDRQEVLREMIDWITKWVNSHKELCENISIQFDNDPSGNL